MPNTDPSGMEDPGAVAAPAGAVGASAWTRTALFFTCTVAMACLFSLGWFSRDTGAHLGSRVSGEGAWGKMFSLTDRSSSGGSGLEVVVERALEDRSPFAYRWWLNGHLVRGYGKSTFPAAGLKKRDEVRVAVLGKEGEVLAKKRLTVSHSPLSLTD